MRRIKWRALLPGIVLFAVLAPSPAYAYLDPGTASLVLQGIIGAIGAGFFVLGGYWRKFIGFFKKEVPDAEAEKKIDSATGDKNVPN